MTTVWRFTGPPENWITALTIKKWALNDKQDNKNIFEKLQPNDVVLFHSTTTSKYVKKPLSSIIGYGYVGNEKRRKDDYWWIQEINEKENKWPNVVNFKEIFTFSDVSNINLDIPLQDKLDNQVSREIQLLLQNALPISSLNREAKILNPEVPNFPRTGSASKINELYEKIVLNQDIQVYNLLNQSEDSKLDNWIVKLIDKEEEDLEPSDKERKVVNEEIAKARTREELEKILKNIEDRNKHMEPQTRRRISRAIARNPKIALLIKERANYRCELCDEPGFEKRDGTRYVEVHHIEELGKSGLDIPSNMVCVCPRCHRIIHYGSEDENNKLNSKLKFNI